MSDSDGDVVTAVTVKEAVESALTDNPKVAYYSVVDVLCDRTSDLTASEEQDVTTACQTMLLRLTADKVDSRLSTASTFVLTRLRNRLTAQAGAADGAAAGGAGLGTADGVDLSVDTGNALSDRSDPPDFVWAALRYAAPFIARVGVSSSVADSVLASRPAVAAAQADAQTTGDKWPITIPSDSPAGCAVIAAHRKAGAALVCQAIGRLGVAVPDEAVLDAVTWGWGLLLLCGYDAGSLLAAVNSQTVRQLLTERDDAEDAESDDSDEEEEDDGVKWHEGGVGLFMLMAMAMDSEPAGVEGEGEGEGKQEDSASSSSSSSPPSLSSFITVPSVLSPVFLLQAAVPCVSTLLTSPDNSMLGRGRAARLLACLSRAASAFNKGKNFILNPHRLGSSTPEFQLCQSLVSYVVSCPDDAARRAAYRTLVDYMNTFTPGARWWLHRTLILSCPFEQVTGLLLDGVRRDLQARWGVAPHTSKNALTLLFELVASFTNFDESLDSQFNVHLAVLSVYRFLLLRASKTEAAGEGDVWHPEEVKRMRVGYLSALGAAVKAGTDAAEASARKAAAGGGVPPREDSTGTRMMLLQAALDPVMSLL